MQLRRQFIYSAVATLSIIGLGRFLKNYFESQFIVDLSGLDVDQKKHVISRVKSEGLQSVFAEKLQSRWIQNYKLVRRDYLQKGLLIHSTKNLNEQKIIFKNVWQSKAAFQQFCKDVQMSKLVTELEKQFLNIQLQIKS